MAQWQQQLHAQAQAQGQMQQLQQYAQEMDTRWTHGAHRSSTTPELLHHQYQFMGRLTQAIGLQEGVLQSAQRRVDAARQMLVQAEQRLASLKQVLALRQAERAALLRRSEQKQMDEFAAQQYQRTRQQQMEPGL